MNLALLLLPLLFLPAILLAEPPAAPSDLSAQSTAQNLATLEWIDNSNNETGFQFEVTIGNDAPFIFSNDITPDSTSFTFTGFQPLSPVSFRLRSIIRVAETLEFSDWSNAVVIETENINFLTSAFTGTPGQDFEYIVPLDFLPSEPLEVISVLPQWLTFDSTSGTFNATAALEGSIRVNLRGQKGINERTAFIYFNVINEPPRRSKRVLPFIVAAGEATTYDLSQYFEDSDLIRAAEISTFAGPIQLGFYENFPITVANFFRYLELNAWDSAFFHRMAELTNGENFVLQGGGFRPGSSEGLFTQVTQLDPIMNEFSTTRRNIAGSISMAKLANAPNSATNQFFISLNDNSAILDVQNGGFTVFGRATKILAADRISTYPRGTFQVIIDNSQASLADWPLISQSANSPAFDELVTMNEIVEIPTLIFSATTANGSLFSSSTSGNELNLSSQGVNGATTITIQAEDLDGANITETFDALVGATYEQWRLLLTAGDANLDDDNGSASNLQEYAFDGDPADASDDSSILPYVQDRKYTIRHRSAEVGLNYIVETSSTLDSADWSQLWSSADGFASPLIESTQPQGNITLLTFSTDSRDRAFYRTRVTE